MSYNQGPNQYQITYYRRELVQPLCQQLESMLATEELYRIERQGQTLEHFKEQVFIQLNNFYSCL